MLYSNVEFFIFLFVVLVLYYFLGSRRSTRFWILTGASFFFYAWAGVLDSLIFFFVILVSWFSTWLASRSRKYKKFYLTSGVTIMALHLLLWKYGPWIVSLVQEVSPQSFGGKPLDLPLPVGISFFTLQGIAYLVDYGRNEAEYIGFKKFLLFKSFFPQLVAGPIVRLYQLAPQLEVLPRPGIDNLISGLQLFALGFFKKVAIADRMVVWVDPVFNDPGSFNGKSILVAGLAYSVQIWGDFSGYTDMGRGAAKMVGIELPENFYSPYLAKSPSDFWRRWHVTLSEWIRDYIYIPLGGSKGNFLRVAFVALFTMVISGLWHGAAFPFLIWGLYHGALLVAERVFRRFDIPVFDRKYSVFVMFALTLIGWLIFRAPSFSHLAIMAEVLFGSVPGGASRIGFRGIAWGVACCLTIQVLFYRPFQANKRSIAEKLLASLRADYVLKWPRLFPAMAGGGVALVFMLAIFLRIRGSAPAFIYFQF